MPTGWKLTADQKAALVLDYEGGLSLSQIAERYGCTVGNARALLRRRGVARRAPGPAVRKFSAEKVAALVADYQSGMSQDVVAAAHGVGQSTVSRLLREQGVTLRVTRGTGPANGNWKGGRTIQGGYVMVYLAPDDPLAAMRNTQGYVGEHRLVMARHLGRPLLPSETVHHIRGSTTDNRIENLQLRQGQHGNGAAFRCLDCGSANVEAVNLG